MNKSGLLIRLAVVVSFSALAVSYISAQLFYRLTYLNEVELANQRIEQLHQTVASTASIAAYLVDLDLAREVEKGLETNDLVKSAKIQALKSEEKVPHQGSDETRSFPLYSPFQKSRIVGNLYIEPDLHYIESLAIQIGKTNSLVLVAQSILVTLLVVIVSFILITKPIIRIARSLGNLTPGTSKRLDVPLFHTQSELGNLVRDVNELLDKTEHQIEEERSLRKEIEVLEKRFRMLFENSASSIVLIEPSGSILLYNQAFMSLLDKIQINFRKNYGPLLEELFENKPLYRDTFQTSLSSGEIGTGEFKIDTSSASDTTSIWVQVVVTTIRSDDLKEYYQVAFQDISKRRLELEKLSLAADYDKLTQMLNRRSGEKQIVDLMLANTPFSLILLDLNNFKPINDVYGHNSGDEILKHIAQQIKQTIRENDFACRWGGDEFVLVIKNTKDKSIRIFLEKLYNRIKTPYKLDKFDKMIAVDSSFGVARYPDDEVNMQNLIYLADKAMYQAKEEASDPQSLFYRFASDLEPSIKMPDE